MKRLWISIGWTAGLQCLWGLLQVALILWLVDKRWIGFNFLKPDYRGNPKDVPALTDEIVAVLLQATVVVFAIGFVASLMWVIIGWCHRIYAPGQAAGLFWQWLAILLFGAACCCGATYFLVDNTRLVPLDGTVKLAAAAAATFLISYYIFGTFFSTPPKNRPAVPLAARLLPT